MIYRIFIINLLDVVFILYIYCVNLGDSLPAGSTEDYSCSFTLSSEKMDNCRVVIMVTAPEGGVFAVDNVVMCPLNDKVGFEYK